jgi:hypothetical protein
MAAIGAAVALAIGGLAACSGGGQDVVRSGAGGAVAAADPAGALKQAAENTTQAGTAKVSMAFSLTGVPGIDTASFTMDGAIDADQEQSSFSVDLSQLTAALPSSQRAGSAPSWATGRCRSSPTVATSTCNSATSRPARGGHRAVVDQDPRRAVPPTPWALPWATAPRS